MTKEKVLNILVAKEQTFIEKGLLHFKEVLKEEINIKIEEFIVKLLKEHIPKYSTYCINNGVLDTVANKNRSFEDIFRITKYYYPEIKLNELYAILMLMVHNTEETGIRTLCCGSIHKITFFHKTIRDYSNYPDDGSTDISLEITNKNLNNIFTKNYCQELINNLNKPKEIIKKKVMENNIIPILGLAVRGGFRPRICSRHPTHNILRTELPKMKFRSVFRLGSTTEIEDVIDNGGVRVEINSIESVKNSASKRLMKECFTDAGVKTADWFIVDAQGNFIQKLGENSKKISKKELPFPLIIKSLHGSRGRGNTLVKDLAALDIFLQGKDMKNYIIEKFYSYSREYRIHVTSEGYFYTCRKMLKKDTPEDKRFQRHDDNCVWIVEDNPSFEKPVNWDALVADCIKALESLGGDIMAFDVKMQSVKDAKGNLRKDPKWIILESCSAPSFGEITAKKYIEQIPKVATRIALEVGILK